MNPLISVIIPIFNAEKYLNRCLDSIIGQTIHSLEIILIDDGSADKSGAICDEYVKNDTRVRAFHQKHSGTVAARNKGLSVAAGEYISFVDSDDWVSQNFYEQMYTLAATENIDMVWCDVNIVTNNGLNHSHIKYSNNTEEMIRRILRCEVPGWLWNKLIKHSFYNSVSMQLSENDNIMEDMLIAVELLCANPKMGYVAEPLYYYNRTNETAMTASYKNDIVIKGINNIKHIYDYLTAKSLFETYKADFAYLAIKAKLALMLSGNLHKAKILFPYSHKSISAYCMKTPISWIYWLGFNGGKLGGYMLSTYLAIRRLL